VQNEPSNESAFPARQACSSAGPVGVIPFTSRVLAPAHVLIRRVEGEAVLLNLNSERYFGLDPVGARMWELLTTSHSIQAAYENLLKEYDVGSGQLRENLETLLRNLLDNGLIEVAGE
jgi:hypothetical protein